MGPNPNGKARIVARIRGQSKKDSETLDGASKVFVSRPDEKLLNLGSSGRVKISFGSDQVASGTGKQCYELDECYEQDVGTEEMFSKEIKPLISGLFEGQNSTVFAFGPRGSGKTYTIQGSEDEHGLVVQTIDSILPRAEEEGKIITVSVFEVYQDRVIDLLDSKRPEVSVFEDGQGKIRLKGLSKVKVNSTSEFQKLYVPAVNSNKPLQKTVDEPPHRSHIGCIIHVVSPQTENSSPKLVGKINFIDLASYEDSRRKSSDGANLSETTRINKSLYAVHNVLYALNANEARVPYRESKLTRMLQDSLGGINKVLMVSCMNPSFCQETVQTASLASRSCQAGFLASLDPGKSNRNVTRTVMSSPQVLKSSSKVSARNNMISTAMSSPQVLKSSKVSVRNNMISTAMSSPQVLKSSSKVSVRNNMISPRIMKPMSVSASGKKQVGSQMRTSIKKPSAARTEVNGRKLFEETNQWRNSEKGNIISASAPAIKPSAQTEMKLSLERQPSLESSTLEEENSSLLVASDTGSSQPPEEENSLSTATSNADTSQQPPEEDVVKMENSVTATPTCQTPTNGCFLLEDKENKNFLVNNEASPPLTARIRELSNNLKSLCVSSDSRLKIAQDCSIRYNQLFDESLEATTPTPTPTLQPSMRVDDRHEIACTASPWENFHMRGSGMKDSLVQAFLKFINTATKEELKEIKGIGDKRATYILEMRAEAPEPFKKLDDLEDIGLTGKQIKAMLKNVAVNLLI